MGATFFTQESNFNFVHAVPSMKMNISADWSLDQFGITLRESYWGAWHQYTSAAGCDALSGCTYVPQAGVILTDLEGRYNITDALQLAIGANNLFNMHQDTDPWNPNAYCTGAGCGAPANGGNVLDTPLGQFDPNGGYYYGRLTYNF